MIIDFIVPNPHIEIWAAGVTYERSREARQEEAVDGGDVYARVYHAQRPELFFKAHGYDVIPDGGEVGIRHDSQWNVPEAELAVILNSRLEVEGFTIGNDMSSRDIEGENPLYLPQAKVYTASCALGPKLLVTNSNQFPQTTIQLKVERNDSIIFQDETHTSRLQRTLPELIDYLARCKSFPFGVILLTGTGIVPPAEFSLQSADRISITIESIGTLTNTVKVV